GCSSRNVASTNHQPYKVTQGFFVCPGEAVCYDRTQWLCSKRMLASKKCKHFELGGDLTSSGAPNPFKGPKKIPRMAFILEL
ncbi:hypothetical protein U0070_005665, partial [Myodes glareolus]